MMPRARSACAQVRDAVVGAAQLEAEDRLQVFALEQDAGAQPRRQPRRGLERRLAADVVHPARQYEAQDLLDSWWGQTRGIHSDSGDYRGTLQDRAEIGPDLVGLRNTHLVPDFYSVSRS